jgi:adenylate cyclase
LVFAKHCVRIHYLRRHMALQETHYLPSDRLQALTAGTTLSTTSEGSALFADISGFTPATEALRMALGARRGAEALALHLNKLYEALIAEVNDYGGAIISFSGDAITVWFNGETSARRAVACGFALLHAMSGIEEISIPDREPLLLGLKVAITSGTSRRFVIGNPEIQLIDTLAGNTVARLAAGESLAERDELLADRPTVDRLADRVSVREWRGIDPEQFGVIEYSDDLFESNTPSTVAPTTLPDEVIRRWLLPVLANNIRDGYGEFQIELRLVTALFLRFSGIDYDEDPEAEEKLNRFVQLVQSIVHGYEGNVLQLTIGDKGSYIYAAFGAPVSHEDDTTRALYAALDLREQTSQFEFLEPIQIGISRGIMRTGAYGSSTRRTYGVLGDEVNLAARLMSKAEPGSILISETLLGAKLDEIILESLDAIPVKGKAQPVRVFKVIGRREPSFAQRFYTTPLVGRDNELNQMQAILQPLSEGRHAGMTFIYGEPGMGKSRLAFELQQRLKQDATNVTWLTGQADALNRTLLGAFIYFLRPWFGQIHEQNYEANFASFDRKFDELLQHADEVLHKDLMLYRSFLAGVVGLIIPDSPYETADDKLRLDNSIAAIKTWVRTEARRQPIVLHLEDAQWLDTISIRMVQNLTFNLDDTPLALVLTSRYNDDGTPYTIPDIFGIPVHNINLNRLTDQGTEAVASSVLGKPLTKDTAQFLWERAEGNPFFTEQLALDLRERGSLQETDGMYDLRSDAAAEVPSGVNAVLIARLDRLAAQVRNVVQTAAVLGREFEVEILSRMLREDQTTAIREAEHEAIWSALSELRYLFRHALLRDAAYDMQAQERLKELHRLAAQTIERLYPGDETQYDLLLEHWHSAGELDRQLHYLPFVAKRLINITAQYDAARAILERVLSQLDVDDSRRATLLNLMSVVHLRQGNFSESETAAQQARLLASSEDPDTLATSLYRLGDVTNSRDAYSEAQAYIQESLAIWRELGNKVGIADNLNLLGNMMQRQGAYADARTYLDQGITIWTELGNQERLASTLLQVGVVARMQGLISEARHYAEQSLLIRREIGDRAGIAACLTQLGTIARLEGNYQEAQRYHEQGLSIRREIGDRLGVANSLISIGNIAFARGELAETRSYFERSLAALRDLGEPLGIAGSLNNLGVVAALLGDYQAAEGYYLESLTIKREIGDQRGIADSINNLGTLAFRKGDYQAAEPYYREGLSLHRDLNDGFVNSSRLWLARSLLRLNRIEEARDLLREGIKAHRDDDTVHKLALSLTTAELYAKLDQPEPAAELAGLILAHPSVDAETRTDVEALMTELRRSLDAAEVDAAFERGKTFDLDQIIERLDAEFM